MAKNALYNVHHRRRRSDSTDFRTRLALVKSGKTRMVVRKSLSHMQVQFVNYQPSGDKTVASASSTELAGYGWKTSCGNVTAAYLTGLLAGKRAKKQGVAEAVLDIGLQVSTKGSRIYAALKGALDAGIAVPHDADILPSHERISGAHIASYSKSATGVAFSKYKTAGVQPSEIAKHFEAAKRNIEAKGE